MMFSVLLKLVNPASLIAAIHAGRLLRTSICSFSIKIESVRSQLLVSMARARGSELPTRLQSGCVFIASGVFDQQRSCVSNILIQISSATASLGKGWFSKGHV